MHIHTRTSMSWLGRNVERYIFAGTVNKKERRLIHEADYRGKPMHKFIRE